MDNNKLMTLDTKIDLPVHYPETSRSSTFISCLYSLSLCMLSPSQSPTDSGPDSALTDIINTDPGSDTGVVGGVWPGSGPRTSDGWPGHWPRGGDETIQPPALRTQEELGAKTENSLQLKLTLNKLYHNSSCHKRPILEGYLSSNSPSSFKLTFEFLMFNKLVVAAILFSVIIFLLFELWSPTIMKIIIVSFYVNFSLHLRCPGYGVMNSG